MSRIKKILLSILFVLIIIQFIQPAPNKTEQLLPTDITKICNVPDSIQNVLKTACYDCHSNNTNYPWYASVQPIGWMLNHHIQNGKKQLNFSDFGSYSVRRQKNKLKSMASQITDGAMPLSSYSLMHKNARLTKEVKSLIINWAQQSKGRIAVKN